MRKQLNKHNWSFESLSKSAFLEKVEDKMATSDPDEPERTPEFVMSIVDPNIIKSWEKKERSSHKFLLNSKPSTLNDLLIDRPGNNKTKDLYFNPKLSPRKSKRASLESK